MYLYVEMWKARPAWLALGQAEREQFFATVGQEIGNQLGAGAELVGVARNDTDTPHRADYDYVAVWKIPDMERVHAFAETWVRVGFHTYFDQEDVRGELMAPEAFIGHHLGL